MGPLRLNLSTRGIGVSAGVRGARISVGPRGTYITVGRGGFQYRTKLASGSRRRVEMHAPAPAQQVPEALSARLPTDPGFIQTASASELLESSPENALAELEGRLRRANLFGWYLAVAAIACLFAPSTYLLALACLAGVPVFLWDRERRTARIIYDVDSEELVARLALANTAGQHLASSSSLWHIFYAVPTRDWKRNAGAGSLIQRTATRAVVGSLPHVELNVEPFCVPVGPQELLFLPDRLIVWDGKAAAGLAYQKLLVGASTTRFIEDGSVPGDAQQVGTTWRYVRKDGGPDGRFKDNRQLPIMHYGELTIETQGGLKIVLQTSTLAAAEEAVAALRLLGQWERSVAPIPPQATSPRVSEVRVHAAEEAPPSGTGELVGSIATVFRYIAAADRRIAAAEVKFVTECANRLLPAPEVRGLPLAFEGARTDADAVIQALDRLAQTDADFKRKVVELATELSLADGKATPKELERLAEVRAHLSGGQRNAQ